jgi:TRAP-type C4-dicarboxylate transport system permease small subunit
MEEKNDSFLEEFSDFLIVLINWSNVILLLAMVVSVTLQVITRYFFSAPLQWTEEASRFFMVWMIFLGASLLIKDNESTAVTFILEKFPVRAQQIVNIIIKILMLFLMIALLVLSVTQLPKYSFNEISPALRISMLIPKSCIIFGSILIIFQLAHILMSGIKELKETKK